MSQILNQNKPDEDLIALISETFSILAASKFIRRVFRLIPNLIKHLFDLLTFPNQKVVSFSALTLVLLASEIEGANAIINQCSMSVLIELVSSHSNENSISALPHIIKLISNLSVHESGRNAMVSQGLVEILVKKLIHSKDIVIQSETLKMIERFFQDGNSFLIFYVYHLYNSKQGDPPKRQSCRRDLSRR